METSLTKNQIQLAINFVKAGLQSATNTGDLFELLLVVPDNILHAHTPNILTMLFMKRYRQILLEEQSKKLEDKIVLDLNEYQVLTDVVSSFHLVKRKHKGLADDLRQEITNANKVIKKYKEEEKSKYLKEIN